MHSLRLLCRCMGCFRWGEFISIIYLIIFLLHILSSPFVFSRSCRFILPHDICLYSLVCICEFLGCVLSLSIILIYVNNHGLISKLSFLFSVLIIPFESLLFLFFFCFNSFSNLSKFIGGVFFFLFFKLSVFSSLSIFVITHNVAGLPDKCDMLDCLVSRGGKMTGCCGDLLLFL